jgi:hypothetical protein
MHCPSRSGLGLQERQMARMKSAKTKILSVFALGLCSALAFSSAEQASAQANSTCVYYRDISSLNPVDNKTALITTTRRQKYIVTFRNLCLVRQQGEFFVLDRFQLGTCVDHGDVFQSGGVAAPCTVESIAPAPNEVSLNR